MANETKTTKACSTCKVYLPKTSEYFPVEIRNTSGLAGRCRDCDVRTKAQSRHKRKREQLSEATDGSDEYDDMCSGAWMGSSNWIY